jgi:hypothetical protein
MVLTMCLVVGSCSLLVYPGTTTVSLERQSIEIKVHSPWEQKPTKTGSDPRERVWQKRGWWQVDGKKGLLGRAPSFDDGDIVLGYDLTAATE